jgi:hypothetical protein
LVIGQGGKSHVSLPALIPSDAVEKGQPMLRALSLALLLTGPLIAAPIVTTPASAEEAVTAQENGAAPAQQSAPPAARRHECERQQEGVS